MADPKSPDAYQQRLAHLVAISQIDTLYYDHYLLRTRTFLQQSLPLEAYRRLLRQRKQLTALPNQIRDALSDGDWSQVRTLSEEHESKTAELNRYAGLLKLAEAVYERQDQPIDPFSPGMNTIPGVSKKGLALLRTEGREHLEALASDDRQWRDFYRRRLQAFDTLAADAGSGRSLGPNLQQLEGEALEALDEGNYAKLARLADELRNRPDPPAGLADATDNDIAPPDLDFDFSAETVRRAKLLGLEHQHIPSQHREFAPLCKFAWHPVFAQANDNHSDVIQMPEQQLPTDIPAALKNRVQVFASHPMINSGGVRFLPTLVGEDALVETFADPQPGTEAPGSALLDQLGLPHRHRLDRQQIEAALRQHGSRILSNELELDPFDFKLICIPPDLHLRLGRQYDWGKQQLWTHFDGYLVMMDGALRPLAGGDIRYGGLYDLLGISRHYASEHIIARFAVVQRRRLAIWP